jgi:hypothetical protein
MRPSVFFEGSVRSHARSLPASLFRFHPFIAQELIAWWDFGPILSFNEDAEALGDMDRSGCPTPEKPRRILFGRKRVYFVDQHAVLRAAMSRLINTEPSLKFCGGEARPEYAVAAITRLKADLIIVGTPLGALGALGFIEQLRHTFPSISLLAYSWHDESIYVQGAMRAGASAYIVTETGCEHLLQLVCSLLFPIHPRLEEAPPAAPISEGASVLPAPATPASMPAALEDV